jgi:Flp pilus assembly protein TadD
MGFGRHVSCFVLLFSAVSLAQQSLLSRDLKITLPKRSHFTPVQLLNREGVEAVRKHHYDQAENLFYKAYLYDPSDPFTLNNLGYISELQGQVERARQFYDLAAQQASSAVIDIANSSQLRGQPMQVALSNVHDLPMQVNRENIEAIRLLSEKRAGEAEDMLQRALSMSPQNPFTLNNLGLAAEAQGDFDGALRYYTLAAQAHSEQPVAVTLSSSWRGKPISEMAAENAKRLRKRLQSEESSEAQASRLNMRGVVAVNRNDWSDADRDFRRAYALDPSSAFSLNNIGYLSERYGDLETAQFFYDKAEDARNASTPVGIATKRSAEGLKLAQVANDEDQKVDQALAAEIELKRKESAPIVLMNRDNQPISETGETAPQSNTNSPQTPSGPPAQQPQHP